MNYIDVTTRVLNQWKRELPELETDTLEIFARMCSLVQHYEKIEARALREVDLRPWEFEVLSSLRRLGPPYHTNIKSILDPAFVSSGTMTNRVDRLVDRGLVERHVDPNDGRGVQVLLTQKGKDYIDRAIEHLVDCQRDMLRKRSVTETTSITEAIKSLAPVIMDRYYDIEGNPIEERRKIRISYTQ